MMHCEGMDRRGLPDQAKHGHVPCVPSCHKGREGVFHVDQDVHVAYMVAHNHRCSIETCEEVANINPSAQRPALHARSTAGSTCQFWSASAHLAQHPLGAQLAGR